MKFFNVDGPLHYYGNMLYDLFVINLLWLLLTIISFGVLTGPVTIASYHSIYHGIVLRDGYTFRSFFSSLKRRFFLQLSFSLFYFLLVGLTVFNLYVIHEGMFGSFWLLPFYFFTFFELLLFGTIAFPLLAENRNLSFRNFIKISFFLANKHLPWSFLCAAANLLLLILISLIAFGYLHLSFLLIFYPGISAFLLTKIIYKKVLENYAFFQAK